MKQVVIISLSVVLTLGAVAAWWSYRVSQRLEQIPKSIERPFASWETAWELPPLKPTEHGGYWLVLKHDMGSPSHNRPPLQVAVIDKATGKELALDGRFVGVERIDGLIVGEFHPQAAHRYIVTVDPKQARECADRRESLEITLSDPAMNNYVYDAIFP